MSKPRTHRKSGQQMELPLYPFRIRRRKLPEYWRDAMEKVNAGCAEEAVLRLYECGLSMRDVADAISFSYATVNDILHDIGADIRSPGGDNNPYGRAGRPDKPHWSR